MSELREVIAKVIDPEAFGVPDPIAHEIAKWDYLTDRDEARARADAALRALSEAGRTYEQGVADGEARLLYVETTMSNEIADLKAQLAQARNALFGVVMADSMEVAVACAQSTLAALTAGSTEGKDG